MNDSDCKQDTTPNPPNIVSHRDTIASPLKNATEEQIPVHQSSGLLGKKRWVGGGLGCADIHNCTAFPGTLCNLLVKCGGACGSSS